MLARAMNVGAEEYSICRRPLRGTRLATLRRVVRREKGVEVQRVRVPSGK